MKHSYQVFEDFLKSHRLKFRGGMKESRRLINSTREKKSPNNEKFLEPGVGDLKIAFYSEAIYLSVFHAFLISINFINSLECREQRVS